MSTVNADPAPTAQPGSRADAGARRRALAARAWRVAADQDGVISRAQLRAVGLTRGQIRTEVRAGRWRRHGDNTIAVHTADLSGSALRWRAVWEVGAGAALDGVTALIAAGLTGFTEELIHVSVPRSANPRTLAGVMVHQTRRRRPGDLLSAGTPRVRPAVAAVRGALWAVSDRQATLIVVMAVQQRLTTAAAIRAVLESVRRDRRRKLLVRLVRDISNGAESLGELDFARLCRRRGLPEPTRQVVRRGAKGRIYLDVGWEEIGLVVEIDGAQHGLGLAPFDDSLRQNAVTIGREMVLRIPLLGLRLAPGAFLDQVVEAIDVCQGSPRS